MRGSSATAIWCWCAISPRGPRGAAAIRRTLRAEGLKAAQPVLDAPGEDLGHERPIDIALNLIETGPVIVSFPVAAKLRTAPS